MTRFVVDAWAWIEYLDGSDSGKRFQALIEDEKNTMYTSSVTVAEVVSRFVRKGKDPEICLRAMHVLSRVLDVDGDLAEEAGRIHAEWRRNVSDVGLADAFVLASARNERAKVLTGDLHFKGVKEALLIR